MSPPQQSLTIVLVKLPVEAKFEIRLYWSFIVLWQETLLAPNTLLKFDSIQGYEVALNFDIPLWSNHFQMSDANSYCQVVESSTGQDQGQASRKGKFYVLLSSLM